MGKNAAGIYKKVWLDTKRCGRFQGYQRGIPDHHNNNETDNRYIKECQDRKRLGYIQFFSHAESNLVYDWSRRRREESHAYIPFQTHPQLQLNDWTDAWQWSSLNKSIVKYKQNGRDLYCMPGGLEKAMSVRDITKYFNIVDEKSWKTFDEFANHIHTIHYVSFNKKDWSMSTCSCEWWAKN